VQRLGIEGRVVVIAVVDLEGLGEKSGRLGVKPLVGWGEEMMKTAEGSQYN